MLRISTLLFALLTVLPLSAQNTVRLSQPVQPDAASPLTSPSALLQPALDSIRQTLANIHLEKWKSNTRPETENDLHSIQRDLDTTLPPLLAAADAVPASVAGSLPASRNIDALYNVLLRIAQRAQLFAPYPQREALEQARDTLDRASRSFAGQMQTNADAQEKQLSALEAALRSPSSANTVPTSAAPCPAPSPIKPRSRPKAKPATTTHN